MPVWIVQHVLSGAPNVNFNSENICSEEDLRSRIFGTFVVKFLACLVLLVHLFMKSSLNIIESTSLPLCEMIVNTTMLKNTLK